MKKHISTIILVMMFLLGLGIVLYPTVSDFINTRNQIKTIENYEEAVNRIDTYDLQKMKGEAASYNQKIASMGQPNFIEPPYHEEYEKALNISGDGVMGYITIPCIGVKLPIYHGTSDAVLQIATGHIEGSSLPIGGADTHCIISGHRGLPSANLFTHLDRVKVGDSFNISVLGEVHTYEVDKIDIVEPADVSRLNIEKGQDYVTLVTCTPYGINTHRLLVRGKRVATKNLDSEFVNADAYPLDKITVTVVSSIPLAIVILIGMRIHYRRKKAKQKNNESEDRKNYK